MRAKKALYEEKRVPDFVWLNFPASNQALQRISPIPYDI